MKLRLTWLTPVDLMCFTFLNLIDDLLSDVREVMFLNGEKKKEIKLHS